MSRQFARDVALEIARGNFAGMSGVNKFGRNADIDTAQEDIWDGGGTWVAPTTARTHDIASTSTNDDGSPAGTGARTIRIWGLTGWSTAEVSEDITMDGTADVATANSYVIIHRMQVLTWGSAGPNDGTITATAQTDGTVTARIDATDNDGQTQMAIYGIPDTQTAYCPRWYASVNKSGGSASGGVDVVLKYNSYADNQLTGFLVKCTEGILYAGNSRIDHVYNPYASFAGPGILKLSGAGSGVNNDVSGGFDLILVDN